MREDFQKWLKSDAPMMTVVGNNKVDFYFKAKRDDRFDIIFWQHGDKDGAMKMSDLEYSGLYDRVSEKIFDAQHTLRTIAVSWGYDEKTSYESIPSAFAKDVRLRINGIINNDRDNLTIKSESQLKDYNAKSRLSDREWRSGEESKRLFFAGRTPDDVIYDSHYKISEYDSNSFISKNSAFTVSWGTSTSASGTFGGYYLERQINGGAWTQIYQGAATSFSQTFTRDQVNTVNYRVRAYSTGGLLSGYTSRPPTIHKSWCTIANVRRKRFSKNCAPD